MDKELNKHLLPLCQRRDELQSIAFKKRMNTIVADINEFLSLHFPEDDEADKLDIQIRLEMIPTFTELPEYGEVMSLKEFIKYVETGCFIDYDGSGDYVKDGKRSDITIRPSDVEKGCIRKDFDEIIWFNR